MSVETVVAVEKALADFQFEFSETLAKINESLGDNKKEREVILSSSRKIEGILEGLAEATETLLERKESILVPKAKYADIVMIQERMSRDIESMKDVISLHIEKEPKVEIVKTDKTHREKISSEKIEGINREDILSKESCQAPNGLLREVLNKVCFWRKLAS